MKFWKKALAILVACLIFGAAGVPALAALPDHPEDGCVLDSAGVLSDATEGEINRKNESLFESTGAEIAIAAVDFLGGQDIDDYAYSLFNYWGVGSQERNNGLLLVLAIGEDDYYAVPGYGIDDLFSGGELQTLLDDYLEEDFAKGDYDAGVKKFFDAAYAELSAYDYNDGYGQQDYNQGGAYEDYSGYYSGYDGGEVSVFAALVGLIVFIIFIVVIVRVLSALFRSLAQGGAGRGYYNRGTPYYQNYTSSGGFWRGLFLGNLLSRRRGGWYRPYGQTPPPPGGWGQVRPPRSGSSRPRTGGFSSFGGFGGSSHSGGGFTRGGGASRSSGGFSRGGGSRGGGAGRR